MQDAGKGEFERGGPILDGRAGGDDEFKVASGTRHGDIENAEFFFDAALAGVVGEAADERVAERFFFTRQDDDGGDRPGFFAAADIGNCPAVRGERALEFGEEDGVELESLGGVHGHDADGRRRAGAGSHGCNVSEEVVDGGTGALFEAMSDVGEVGKGGPVSGSM